MKRPWHAFLRRHGFWEMMIDGARVLDVFVGGISKPKTTKEIKGFKDDFLFESLDSDYSKF